MNVRQLIPAVILHNMESRRRSSGPDGRPGRTVVVAELNIW
jgi:hypothetical protein